MNHFYSNPFRASSDRHFESQHQRSIRRPDSTVGRRDHQQATRGSFVVEIEQLWHKKISGPRASRSQQLPELFSLSFKAEVGPRTASVFLRCRILQLFASPLRSLYKCYAHQSGKVSEVQNLSSLSSS